MGKSKSRSDNHPNGYKGTIHLFHGSAKPIKSFKFGNRKHTGVFGDTQDKANVVFFAEDKANAEWFGNWRNTTGKTYVTEVSIPKEKILDLTFPQGVNLEDKEWWRQNRILKKIDKAAYKEWDEGGVSIQQLMDDNNFIKNVKKAGYSGVRFKEPENRGITIGMIDLKPIRIIK